MDTENLPARLRVPEIIEALEAWAMLTEDRMKREIYEAREKARRDAEDWRSALERAEQRLQDSFAEGRQTGLAEGLIGQIRLCEELLGRPPRAEAELAAMSVEGLRQLADQLHAELRHGRKADG